MSNGVFQVPTPFNEPILEYRKGSPERERLVRELKRQHEQKIEIPLIIGGREVHTGNTGKAVCPHDHKHVLADYHKAGQTEVEMAIEAAMQARADWASMPWEHRASIFIKAAELISTKYRYILNAATMLNQSKNPHQAEIEATSELADFFRFNSYGMQQIYEEQPLRNGQGEWNRMEYRALEGFVFAVTPFNFTAIGGNLPTAAAMMGNVALWKPASTAILSNYYIMKLLEEAGLPAGVINFIPGSGREIGELVFKSKHFAGVHFTGSTAVFKQMWETIGKNMDGYLSYPRIVGETGGKDFVVAHGSAEPKSLAVALLRGAYEFQGQKCSAASRAYLPESLWPEVKRYLGDMIDKVKKDTGDPMDFKFFNALIDEKSFDQTMGYLDKAKESDQAEIIFGGQGDKSKGYFIEPTVILTQDPHFVTMEEELFAPVLTVYVYPDDKYSETLKLCEETSPYALTGSIFARDRQAILEASQVLRDAAGNFYINDKPTGSVVGRQPFGGARASGTNDKAGSKLNLLRWASARSIKENLTPPESFEYPFMD
jgi:1-pyrroline-5-carboxylate dehydrogenase